MKFIRIPRPLVLRQIVHDQVRTTIELRGLAALPLFVVSLVVYLLTLSKVAVFGAAAVGLLLGSSYIWALTMARSVTAERNLVHTAIQVGDELEENIHIVNRSRLPVLWAEIHDLSDLPGHRVSSVRATGGTAQCRWRIRTICQQRGIFRLGPWELHTGDPFGLFLTRIHQTKGQEIVVYPPLAVLPRAILPHKGHTGDLRRDHYPIHADTITAVTTRPYIPGDPIRHIHWPTTAHEMEIYVKSFEPEAKSTVWLLPDFDAGVHLGEGDHSTEEKMVIVVASLAEMLLRNHMSVGLFTHTQEPIVIEPGSGLAHLWTILRSLTPLHTVRDCSLDMLLEKAAMVLSPGDICVLVTPSSDTRWVSTWMGDSSFRSTYPHVILLDPGKNESTHRLESVARSLLEHDITSRIVPLDQIRPIEGSYGELRRWEFKTLATGRSIPVRRPRMAQAMQTDTGAVQ
jgi:uncharacterized protein (DUF58 family)